MFWEGEIAVNSFIRLQSRNFLITEFGFPVGFKIGRYCGFSFVFKLLKWYFYQVKKPDQLFYCPNPFTTDICIFY